MQRQSKKKIIKKNGKHEKDTGSPQVQVAILTVRINELSEHLQTHKKDNHSRKGLLEMVGKRRQLLNYVKKTTPEVYEKLVLSLELRK